jgi:hypothetical protein
MKKLNPNWITGFTDAEGCFFMNLTKNPLAALGAAIKQMAYTTVFSRKR